MQIKNFEKILSLLQERTQIDFSQPVETQTQLEDKRSIEASADKTSYNRSYMRADRLSKSLLRDYKDKSQ